MATYEQRQAWQNNGIPEKIKGTRGMVLNVPDWEKMTAEQVWIKMLQPEYKEGKVIIEQSRLNYAPGIEMVSRTIRRLKEEKRRGLF